MSCVAIQILRFVVWCGEKNRKVSRQTSVNTYTLIVQQEKSGEKNNVASLSIVPLSSSSVLRHRCGTTLQLIVINVR